MPHSFIHPASKATAPGAGALRSKSLRLAALLGLAASALLGTIACGKASASQAPPSAPPPPEVIFSTVVQKDVSLSSEWVATLDGYVNAQIKPNVTGYLIKQNYQEGALVHKGDVLFDIDPRPFQAALDIAKGQLALAKAQLGKAELDVQRDTPLAEAKAIPQSQMDNDTQAKLSGAALVESANAAVAQAQLNLGFTKVTSLVNGIAGIAQGQIGDLVGPANILTSVSQVDPIKAYFSISEQEYLLAQRSNLETTTSTQKNLLNGLALDLVLSDGTVYAHKGKALLADRQVNPLTGTIRIVGVFPNPGNVLRPGQYGRIQAATTVKKDALLVPQRAVKELQGGYQVALIGSDDKAEIRTVQAEERVGGQWIIGKGVKAGDRVIIAGQQKVTEGMQVVPKADDPSKPVDAPAGGK